MKLRNKQLVFFLALLLLAVLFFGGREALNAPAPASWETAAGSAETPAPAPADVPGLPAADTAPAETDAPEETPALDEDGVYTAKDELALYIHTYGHLPSNFITKKEAQAAGWTGGSLEPYCPGKCIGGDRFGNREGLLPESEGRTWTECDVNTLGASSRGAERLVFSNDGLIFYTADHYASFEQLY